MTSIITQTIKPFCITLIAGLMGTTAISCQSSATTSTSPDVLPVAQETITVAEKPSLPEPNENGDYRRSPHQTWKVVDIDPNGLNCRMIDMTYDELIDPSNDVELDIINWPVVGTLKQEQKFKINLGPAGFGVVYDTRQKPWIFVDQTMDSGDVNQCFVRANQKFVQPVID
jgi:hypothetical protein